jgi:hypothetical protein
LRDEQSLRLIIRSPEALLDNLFEGVIDLNERASD